MEERGVPVQDDWPMAPDDDKVRFSLSGVTSHSWGGRKHKSKAGRREGKGQGAWGKRRRTGALRGTEVLVVAGRASVSSLLTSPGLELLPPRGGANFSQHILPQAQHLLGRDKDCSSGDTGHPAAVTREHPRSPRDSKQLSLRRKRKKQNRKAAAASLPAGFSAGRWLSSNANTTLSCNGLLTRPPPAVTRAGDRPPPSRCRVLWLLSPQPVVSPPSSFRHSRPPWLLPRSLSRPVHPHTSGRWASGSEALGYHWPARSPHVPPCDFACTVPSPGRFPSPFSSCPENCKLQLKCYPSLTLFLVSSP